tara:strand:+ start:7466 stop:8005 length:540 start_codon:yes stop_codon:yes gene_type:complete
MSKKQLEQAVADAQNALEYAMGREKQANLKLEVAQAALEVYQPTVWEPAIDEAYYTVTLGRAEVICCGGYNERAYQSLKALGLVFRTREEAQIYLNKWLARVRIENRIKELDAGVPWSERRWCGLRGSFVGTGGTLYPAQRAGKGIAADAAMYGRKETIEQVIKEKPDDYQLIYSAEGE